MYSLQLLYKNGEDLQDLVNKLEQQKKSIEQEINELSSPEFSNLRDIKGLVQPLEQYGAFV
jgi:cell division protein FtsL